MHSLLEVQRGLRSVLMGGDVPSPAWIAGDDAAERLAVYRGTIRTTFVKALRLNFPTVERLVGREFFEGAASLFAHGHTAGVAVLDAYGEAFPAFLQDLAQCEHLEYLADVARLDWAVARALHAPDAQPVPAGALAGYLEHADDLRFIAHPSISFLHSAFAVHEIWRAVLSRDEGLLAAIDLTAGPVHLIVQRIRGEVEVVAMDSPEWLFAKALLGGLPLGRAVEEAHVDAGPALARHLAAGRIVAVDRHHTEECS